MTPKPEGTTSKAESPPVLILGDGGWGTALAILLSQSGCNVRLWSHDPLYASILRTSRRNPKFLPGITLPQGLQVESDIDLLSPGVELVLSVVPTQFLRNSLDRVASSLPPTATMVSCSKGLERETLQRPSEILAQYFPDAPLVVLSGPSHAEEVSRGLPATVVAASNMEEAARTVQKALSGPTFRVYRSTDPLGVEIAGAAKNIIAIAAGIADGLGFGDNARAGLITRGLREIARLGAALGAQPETFPGLSGMGDLIVTCTSSHSRNHTVGFRVGRGEPIRQILALTEKVAEGVETTRSIHTLSANLQVEVPITREVYAVLFQDKPPRQAVEDLMSRESKAESV